MKEREECVIALENNLRLVRKCVGWTAQELAKKTGIARQTISSIENKTARLTKTQYIAIKSVIMEEIANHKDETEMAAVIFDAFVERPNEYSDEARKELLEKAEIFSEAVLNDKKNRKNISKTWVKIVGPVLGAVALSLTTIAITLKKK